jgi:hypothetical protein
MLGFPYVQAKKWGGICFTAAPVEISMLSFLMSLLRINLFAA